MRRGERAVWDCLATACRHIATSQNAAEEYVAKIEMREAWAKLNGIAHVSGIPRSGARP